MYKFFTLILILLLCSCGYQPINKVSNFNFWLEIDEIKSENIIKQELKKLISRYSKNSNKTKKYQISIKSSTERIVSSKNTSGEATNYNLLIVLNVTATNEKQVILKKKYEKNISYNTTASKFELKQYEDILKKDASREIFSEVINDLTLIR